MSREHERQSLVELENEKRAVHRTAVGKLLYMCQERADIMYTVKGTAPKIFRPTESEKMIIKRITRYLKGVPIAKVPDRHHHIPTVREHVH